MKRDPDVVREMNRNHRKMQMLQGYRSCEECNAWRISCRICHNCREHCTCEVFDKYTEVPNA